MDKETLSNYGWIVICVLVMVVMIALAGPFGNFVADAVKSTTQGLFDVNQNALDAAGITIEDQTFWEAQNGAKIYYDRVYAADLYGVRIAGIWNRDGSVTIFIEDMYNQGMMERFATTPSNKVVISENKVTCPDTFVPEETVSYEAINDGESVMAEAYYYTWDDNKEITNREYFTEIECIITDYTSIEMWYNAIFNS